RRARDRRQPGELAQHEVDDVVGVSLGMNAIEVPGPADGFMVEGEQAFVDQREHELDGEEWIARCLVVHELDKRRGVFGLATKRVCKQLAEMPATERRERDLHDASSPCLD